MGIGTIIVLILAFVFVCTLFGHCRPFHLLGLVWLSIILAAISTALISVVIALPLMAQYGDWQGLLIVLGGFGYVGLWFALERDRAKPGSISYFIYPSRRTR